MTYFQPLPVVVSIISKYLKYVTVSSVCLYTLNANSAPVNYSSSASHRLFWSVPHTQIAVVGWQQLSASQVTIVLQAGQRGWVKLPSFRITTMSRTWSYTK